eukprot:TCONS_00028825-protein
MDAKKKQQRVIPNDVNLKSDLHRLRVILQSENVSNSATKRLKDRYELILKKAIQQKKQSGTLLLDENASNVIRHEKLEDYCKNSSGICKPVKTTADGNCLFNAVSKKLCGDEKLHLVLRLLTSIELYMNWRKYFKETRSLALTYKSSFKHEFDLMQLFFNFTSSDKCTNIAEMPKIFRNEATHISKPC